MILFECPGMIEPLDTATLARCRIIPFFGQERYDSWISEQSFLPMDRALRAAQRKSLFFMKNASPKMQFKPCILLA